MVIQLSTAGLSMMMTATSNSPEAALEIELTYPNGIYSGSSLGTTEEVPSHARLHEAFVAAAAGGPWADVEGRVLVATADHRRALKWLEENEPIAMRRPQVEITIRRSRRYRWRASPETTDDTPFEPMAALGGSVAYYWPSPPDEVRSALEVIAAEVTHVGRADSVVIVHVAPRPLPASGRGVLWTATGRGPGTVLRIPRQGRLVELERAHAEACQPGPHRKGSVGKQASDEQVTGANDAATEPRRFVEADPPIWPFTEIVRLSIAAGPATRRALEDLRNRVPAAVGIHRALIRRLDRRGIEVPAFVLGRDSAGPLRTPGHLAIHVVEQQDDDGLEALLAIPVATSPADREQLLKALAGESLRAGIARTSRNPSHWFTLTPNEIESATSFWRGAGRVQSSTVPIVLEAAGGPRRGSWSLSDSTVCSVGYALRSVLEQEGFEWGKGWEFRQHLVAALRDQHSVQVKARRLRIAAGRFVHRASASDLLVAVAADVDLGSLAPQPGSFLALGRARHLGGGLLTPVAHPARL